MQLILALVFLVSCVYTAPFIESSTDTGYSAGAGDWQEIEGGYQTYNGDDSAAAGYSSSGAGSYHADLGYDADGAAFDYNADEGVTDDGYEAVAGDSVHGSGSKADA